METTIANDKGFIVTLVGAVANIALSALKIAGGVFGNSAAMIADGVHSLSDLATDITVLVTLRLANRPKDKTHPYGHGKIETFGALIVGLVLVGVAFELFFDGIRALIAGQSTSPTILALIAALVSIVVKELLYRYTVTVGKKTGQISVMANAWHHRTDALSSIAAAVGIGGAMFGIDYLDQAAAVGVSLFIAQAGARIAWTAFSDLIDASIDPKTIDKFKTVIESMREVQCYHALRTRKVGSDILIDVHIQISADTTVAQGHRIGGILKSRLMQSDSNVADVLVHVEPDTSCSLRPCLTLNMAQIHSKVKEILLDVEWIDKILDIELTPADNGCHACICIELKTGLKKENIDHFQTELMLVIKNVPDISEVELIFEKPVGSI